MSIKVLIRQWFFLVAVISACGGCRIQTHPHILRIAFNSGSTDWHLSVNGDSRGGALSGLAVRRELGRLRLGQGDVMVVGLPRPGESTGAGPTIEWLWGFCQSNSVAVYLLPEPFPGVEMFSARAYHWTAPFENPFDLADASFFREGRLLGRSTNGFERMLQEITRDRPRQVFILGSLFDTGRSFPPDPSPYEHQRDRLYDVLRAAGTDFVQLDALP